MRTKRPKPIRKSGLWVVCAPADSPMVVPGSDFTHVCECGTRVMLAPSGQRYLKAHPAAKVICYGCIPDDDVDAILAADIETIISEARTAQHNFYRERN
jgi:hypothetical protein